MQYFRKRPEIGFSKGKSGQLQIEYFSRNHVLARQVLTYGVAKCPLRGSLLAMDHSDLTCVGVSLSPNHAR